MTRPSKARCTCGKFFKRTAQATKHCKPSCKAKDEQRAKKQQKAVKVAAAATLFVFMFAVMPAYASLAVALITADRIVVASDSRTWDPATDQFAGDIARKVDFHGRYAFIMTGWPAVWSAWERTPPRAGESAKALARRILAAVTPDTEPQEFVIGVARLTAPVDIYAASAVIHPDGRLEIKQEGTPKAPVALSLGWDDDNQAQAALVGQMVAGLQTSPSEARMVAMARHYLATAAKHSPKVGGPSHVAVIDAEGSRWQNSRESTSPDRHWDGANLVIVSQNLTIDQTGISLVPGTSATYDDSRSYAWTVASGDLGVYGWDSTQRSIIAAARWAGADNRPVLVQLSSQYAGTGNPSAVQISAQAQDGDAAVELVANESGGAFNGDIRLRGIPDFYGATSPTAGAIVGYINVKVNGVNARIAVYAP